MILAALVFQTAAVWLPYPWLEYCHRTRDAGCIVETITPRDLALINKVVTEAIETREDSSALDAWEAFPADRRGDCDDQVATERAALIALGLDPRTMSNEVGEVIEPDGRRVNHIVLVVTLDGKRWVMDRKTPDVLYQPGARPYAWRPLARQTQAGPVWESAPDQVGR